MAPSTTSTPVWPIALQNALFIGAVSLPVLAAGTYAVSKLLGLNRLDAFAIVLFVAAVVLFVAGYRSRQRDEAAAGAVLVDAGPHPMKWLFLAIAAFFALIGLGVIDAFERYGIAAQIFLLISALAQTHFAFSRFQVRKNGLWTGGGLLPWARIAGHEWRGDDGAVLVIRGKGRTPFARSSAFPVPIELRSTIDRLLTEHAVPLARDGER